MPLYGDLDQVKAMLRPTEESDLGQDADIRLSQIQIAVSSVMEHKLQRTFGLPVEDTDTLIWAGCSSVLLLPYPARSITTVMVGGAVEAGEVTGGAEYDSDQWTHYPVDRASGAIYGLRLLSGGWWGSEDGFRRPTTPVLVTGDFTGTDDDADIPDDLTYAVNFLISETFKRESASPPGFLGFDEAEEAPRDPWRDPLVKAVTAKYQRNSRELVV